MRHLATIREIACSLEKNEDTKCMCKEFREMASGTCHCGLYTKTE